jgi:hypothetical protein
MTDAELQAAVEREGLPFAWIYRCKNPDDGFVVYVRSNDRVRMQRAYQAIMRRMPPRSRVCIAESP